MEKIKIYIVGSQNEYANFINNHKLVNDIKYCDIVIFTGGADVSPELYKEENVASQNNIDRDSFEISIYNLAQKLHKPCLGICRGSQFLTVMNGGKLIQDVDNHAIDGTHFIDDLDNEDGNKTKISITSTHHQMMYPFLLKDEDYRLIAVSSDRRSTFYINGSEKGEYTKEEVKYEPEIVFYPKTKCLAIQGHPEYMDIDSEAVKYCNKLIKKYLLSE